MCAARVPLPVHSTTSLLSLMLPLSAKLVRTSGTSLALVGASGTQKTALLLQAAIRVVTVSDPKATVLFLAAEEIIHRPHSVHHHIVMDEINGPRILLHYFASSAELIRFLVQYHKTDMFPAAIIIDDLQLFAERKFMWRQEKAESSVIFKILSLSRQLTAFFAQQSHRPCYLLVGSQDSVVLRPAPKHCPDSKTLPCHLSQSLVPTIATLVENVVRVTRHQQSETVDQMNFHIQFDHYLIFLYARNGILFVDRVEDDHYGQSEEHIPVAEPQSRQDPNSTEPCANATAHSDQ